MENCERKRRRDKSIEISIRDATFRQYDLKCPYCGYVDEYNCPENDMNFCNKCDNYFLAVCNDE